MQPKTIVITGASDGIGQVAAGELSRLGHSVLVVGRSPEKTARVAADCGAEFLTADFTRLDDVRSLTDAIRSKLDRIDVLVNNAGGVFGDRSPTADGYEKTFQVNHLAAFLLTSRLMDRLIDSEAAVITTSSVAAARYGKIDIDDLNNERNFSPNKAYGDSKLANILFTKGLHKRFYARGVSAVAFHPGNVATNFASDTTSFFRFVYHTPLRRLLLISPERGARPLVELANGKPGQDWQSGAYYDRHKLGKTNPQADDESLADQLWQRSEEMVGL
jgi:NAD(P)-dependent dehydrogenase (short-subunit alcohol dehydrogenase family)